MNKFTPVSDWINAKVDTINARPHITDYMQGELGILDAVLDDVERLEKERREMYELFEAFDTLTASDDDAVICHRARELKSRWIELRARIDGEA